MADLSDLGQLAPPAGSAGDDGAPVPAAAVSATRLSLYAPRRRGWAVPMAGRITDADVLRNLSENGGWLHQDGRLVANGPCTGFHAFLIVPGMTHVVVAQVQAVAAITTEAEKLGRAPAGGRMDEDSKPHDRWSDPDDPSWGRPNREAGRAIREAGWVRLTMRRDRGAKEIIVGPDDHASPIKDHLLALAKKLGRRIVSVDPEGGPVTLFNPAAEGIEPKPDHDEIADHPLLSLIPGFKSYDFDTGEIEIEGRGRVVMGAPVHPAFDDRGGKAEEPDDVDGPSHGF